MYNEYSNKKELIMIKHIVLMYNKIEEVMNRKKLKINK